MDCVVNIDGASCVHKKEELNLASKAYKKEEIDYIALQCMSLISIKKWYSSTV